jgi:IPT/TIG domain
MFVRRFARRSSPQTPSRHTRWALRALRGSGTLVLVALLPLGAAVSQGVVAQASIPAEVSGTWAMLQVSTPTALNYFRPSIDAALAIPGVTGLSLRAPWTAITTNLGIFEQGVQIAQADHSSLAIRFVSGVDTPPSFLGNSTSVGGRSIPLPWGAGSTPTSFVPNTTFENAYRSTVDELATFARANGVHMLHLPWYSGTTAEIYNGPEVQNAPGYSLQNFITGYERLVAIGMSAAGSDLTVEFPLGGTGTGSVVGPLESYMATTFGSDTPELTVQFNDLTDSTSPIQHPAVGVNMNRQMNGQGDYNWTNVYHTLTVQHSQSVEVYLQSFAASLPHSALLRQETAAFPGSTAISISAVTPAAGPVGGGQAVTVSGSSFSADMTVTIGGVAVSPTNVTSSSFDMITPPQSPGLVEIQVTVTPPGGTPTTATAGYTYVALSNYVPVTPFRILDTRSSSCVQCSGLALGPGATRKLALTGVTGLPSGADPISVTATAVALNVTAVGSTTGGLLAVYPTGTKQPRVSNLNFGPRAATPNLVIATLGEGGAVNIYNAIGSVNVVADVEGYFSPQPSSEVTGEFHPIPPERVCDTRTSCWGHSALTGGTSVVVNVTGAGGIQADGTAEAAVLNLTAVAGTVATFLSVFPTNSLGTCDYGGSHSPPFSTINLTAGSVEANRVFVRLGPASPEGPDTSVCLYNAVGTINAVIDANGWFGNSSATAGSQYQAIGPSRICDTRVGSGLPCAGHSLAQGGVGVVKVAGLAGVPTGSPMVQAIIANVTAIAPTQATYLVLYPSSLNGPPHASDVNVAAGAVLPNLTVVQLDTTEGGQVGDLDVYNSAGQDNLVIDIEGWFQ